ncbi:MAG TPA: hypothetical protein VMW41_00395 [Candidatus Bathyarchaeia archaeon]|nr:hypothetical protein [Candidatus Bathyarchaeia archaeon]
MVENELGKNNDFPPANSSFKTNQIEVIPIPPKKKVKTLLVISLSILLVILLGITTYIAFQNYQLSRQIEPLPSPTVPTPTRITTSTLLPSPSPAKVVIPTAPLTTTPIVKPKSIGPFEIQIIGDDDCVAKTNQALNLLEKKADSHYEVVIRYIGAIECVESGSGMFVWQDPPLFKAGKITINEGTIWYAGTIAHDSCHSKQYHDYLLSNSPGSVPSEIYQGRTAESQCLDVQHDALTKIGANQSYIDYIKNVIETEYWDVDYGERWW